MGNEVETASPRRKSKGFLGLTWGTWVGLALLFPVLFMTYRCERDWAVLRASLAKQDAEYAALSERNRVLGKVFDNLQNKAFQVCNRTADQVTVNWLSVAYQDGRNILVFDSAKCHDWKAPVLAPGDARMLTLNSNQDGCNWDGRVVYYAMQYTRESEDTLNTVNFVGHFKGYDRDCHNIQ